MTNEQRLAMMKVCDEVAAERRRQHERWGEQSLPDGTGGLYSDGLLAQYARTACEHAAANGHVTYRHILNEEVMEAFAESDPEKLRAELVQVAACALVWPEPLPKKARKR